MYSLTGFSATTGTLTIQKSSVAPTINKIDNKFINDNLTPEKLNEVIPSGFGYGRTEISGDFGSTTNYYTYVAYDSLLLPSNFVIGDIVTVSITNSSGTTTSYSSTVTSTGFSQTLNFGSGTTLSLSCSGSGSSGTSEMTYNLQTSESVSDWNYTVTRYHKIDSKYLPATTPTLYEHVYTFKSNREEIFTMSWVDKYATYGTTISTVFSNLTSRCNGKTIIASGYSYHNSGPINRVVVGTDILTPYSVSSASGDSEGNANEAESLILRSYSDRRVM